MPLFWDITSILVILLLHYKSFRIRKVTVKQVKDSVLEETNEEESGENQTYASLGSSATIENGKEAKVE